MATYKMTEKQNNIAGLVAMLLCVFVSVNWIYSRTQLSGWMPLPFTIVGLVGATYQVFDLVGKLLGPTRKPARQWSSVVVLLCAAGLLSVLFISSQGPAGESTNVEVVTEALPESAAVIAVAEDLYIEVREHDYGLSEYQGAVLDLESLIAESQKLISRTPGRGVTIHADIDVHYSRIVEVMSALDAAGVNNISVGTTAN